MRPCPHTRAKLCSFSQVIHHVLRPGGYWIHLGPLLWHWADSGPEEMSLELSLAEVHRLARLIGFEQLRQEFVDAAYIGVSACGCVGLRLAIGLASRE